MIVYVSGPYSAPHEELVNANIEAARNVAIELWEKGYSVICPHTNTAHFDRPTIPYERFLEGDLEMVERCDAMVMLPGWRGSNGANIEYSRAWELGKQIVEWPMLPVIPWQPVVPEETRVTDPKTGGQKGVKPARFDLIPPDPLWELALVYGMGAAKYDDDNWMKGYSWRLSIGALCRHVFKFVSGTYTDSESGRPHLAHAIWHCVTLMEFYRLKLGTDDRFSTKYQSAENSK